MAWKLETAVGVCARTVLITGGLLAVALVRGAVAQTAEVLPAAETPDPMQEIEVLRQRLMALEQIVQESKPSTPAEGESPAACGGACESEPCPCSQCAGYKNGFYVKTCDDEFTLRIRGLLQPRYVSDWRDTTAPNSDANESGFVLERAPLVIYGNAFGPQLQYWMILQASGVSGTEFIEEAKIMYETEQGLLFQVGRFRNPAFLREMDVSYARQLGVDRSYYNSVFTTGVLEGVTLSKQNDSLRWIGFLSDGSNSGAASASKDFYHDNTAYAVTAAIDLKLFGEWAQYGDFSSWSDEESALFFGAAVHVEQGERGDSLPANDLNDFWGWTLDATYESYGFTLFGSTVGRYSRVPGVDIDQAGALFQVSYQVVPDKVEPFFRYMYIDFDGFTNVNSGATAVSDSSLNILSAGANWFFNRQDFKLTVEVLHALDTVPFTAGNVGLLADEPGKDGQTALVTQLQLFF